MTLESQLKDVILHRYKSIREFASTANIPYSTIDSVLKRGIMNSGVSTVIRIFSLLDLDVESIETGILYEKKDEDEKSPSQADAKPGEDDSLLMEYIRKGLVSFGFLREGQDFTDCQAEVVLATLRVWKAVFNQN